MKMKKFLSGCFAFIKRRAFLILWISLIIYLFYDTFIYYNTDRRFYYLRRILGLGLCVSRGTATVLNLCCALVLLPLCKKVNQILYRILSKVFPGLFFFWLENAKSFHMTVAITLVLFAVVHSVSHFVNLWNFSRNYDKERAGINLARYKNENPLVLLMSVAGMTGVTLLLIAVSMGLTAMRVVRRRLYNAFWYTHQLYLPFMVFLMIHPLSGVLKEEVLSANHVSSETSLLPSQEKSWTNGTALHSPKFVPIKSKTWVWMALPLGCFFLDLLWRIFSRNLTRVQVLNVNHMAGGTISLTLRCTREFTCRNGQYVLLQCLDISLLEWHPFTVVKIPTCNQREFVIWVRVKGDWTEALQKLSLETCPSNLRLLVDGPFSSPMEGVSRSDIALCVAAGVGITPFVTILYDMFVNPRNSLPGRIHLIWIVRQEQEITWLADLANRVISRLRYANRPDRLHLEFYVTGTNRKDLGAKSEGKNGVTHIVAINEKGGVTHILKNNKDIPEDDKAMLLTPNRKRNVYLESKVNVRDNKNKYDIADAINEKGGVTHILRSDKDIPDEEKATLLTPNRKRNTYLETKVNAKDNENKYDIAKEYPLVGCRVRRGRPYWDRVFGYWVHLYPGQNLSLYCCGPKKLVKLLRSKCKCASEATKTKFTFIHEAFS